MSCTNIKFVAYPNLSEVIRKKYVNNLGEQVKLLSLLREYNFNTNAEEHPEEALKELEKYRDKKLASANQRLSMARLDKKGLFKNNVIRADAIDYVEKLFLDEYLKNYINGITPSFKSITMAVAERIEKFAKSQKFVNSDIRDNLNDLQESIGVITRYIDEKTGKKKKSISNGDADFINDVVARKSIASFFNFAQVDDYFNEEEHITDDSETQNSVEGSEDAPDNTGNSLFSVGVGQKKDFKDHIRGIVKYHLQLLEKRNSASATDSVVAGQSFGEPLYMDYEFVYNLLFSDIIDKTTKQKFLESIGSIAKKNSEAYGLQKLYQELNDNPNLLNAYYSVFNKPVFPRIVVNIDKFKLTSKQANVNISAQEMIVDDILDGMRSSLLKNSVYYEYFDENQNVVKRVIRGDGFNNIWADLFNEYKTNIKFVSYYANDVTGDRLYSLFKQLVPKVNKQNYINAYRKNGIFDGKAAFADIFGQSSESKNNKGLLAGLMFASYQTNETEEQIKNLEDQRDYDSADENLINATIEALKIRDDNLFEIITRDTANSIAQRLSAVSIRNTSKNSTNVENKQVSDILNKNYMATIMEKLHNGDEETAQKLAEEYFQDNKLIESNFLLEHQENGKITNLGMFRLKDGKYQFTEYYKQLGIISLLDGIKRVKAGIGSTYKSMTDKDYFLTAFALFNRDYINVPKQQRGGYIFGNYLMPIPSDSQHNFCIHAPIYDTSDIFVKDKKGNIVTDENGNYEVNVNSVIYKQFENIARKEMRAMNSALRAIFTIDNNGKVVTRDGKPVYYNGETSLTKEELSKFYDRYHIGEWEETVEVEVKEEENEQTKAFNRRFAAARNNKNDNKKKTEKKKVKKRGIFRNGKLAGNVFKFMRIAGEETYEANDLFRLLSSKLDFFGENGDRLSDDGSIILTQANQDLLEKALTSFIREYYTTSLNFYKNNFSECVFYSNSSMQRMTDAKLVSFIFNDYLVRDSTFDFLGGDIAFYKNPQEILKRIKEIQGSGDAYSVGNISLDDTENVEEDITIKVPRKGENGKTEIVEEKIMIREVQKDGSYALKELKLKNKFNAVTIANTVKSSDNIAKITQQADSAGLSEKEKQDILKPYLADDAMNDAQSYITWQEWIRRTAAIGEIDKYAKLIDEINRIINTPDPKVRKQLIREIDWSKHPNRVQVLKNFYYDLYYDKEVGTHVARQIKNAEFVLIPCFIEGTQLEHLYNAMILNGIDQVNTVETSKVAKHNVITYWDNEGNPTGAKEFREKAYLYKESYNYKYLYRQQVVPQHMVDTFNKLGVQLYKKIQDNFTEEKGLNSIKKFIDNFIENIKGSFTELAAELNIELDENGDLKLDEDGNIQGLNKALLYQKFKENAYRSGIADNLLEFFDVDDFGIAKYPLYMTNMGTKVENVVNGMINNNITRNTLAGFHCAQVSDFGFNPMGTKQNLAFKRVQTIKNADGTEITVYKMEVYATRWSNVLNGINLLDLTEDQRTFIGYRIPTEGKQSIAVMTVVPFPGSEDGFLPDVYGSTMVMPHDWLKQTGSDYDVDSVYTIIKRLYKIRNENQEVEIKTYDNDAYIIKPEDTDEEKRQKYANYLIDNRNKFIKTRLGKRFSKKNVYRRYKQTLILNFNKEINDIRSGKLKDSSYLSFEEFTKLPKSELTSFESRNNAMVDAIIELYSNPETFNETLRVSNFKDISDAIDNYENELNIVNEDNDVPNVAPNSFRTQLSWFKDATSAIKLKGLYVNLSSFASISNRVKGVLDQKITVEYNTDKISLKEARERFGDDAAEEVEHINPFTGDKQKFIRIDHSAIGWSLDNKNVENKPITYYQSQLVAHILDVMKSGSTKNENLFSAYIISLLPSIGVDYNTVIGLLYQPAFSLVVNEWEKGQSVLSLDKSFPVNGALKQLMAKLDKKFKPDNVYISNAKLLEKFDELFTIDGVNQYEKLFGTTVQKTQSNFVLNAEHYKSRLYLKDDDIKAIMFDVYTVLQINSLDKQGRAINNQYNVLRTDGYGAKKSFFETYNVFHKLLRAQTSQYQAIFAGEIKEENNTKSIIATDDTFLKKVFGAFSYRTALKLDVDKSAYKPLAAYLKYSSAFSIALGNALMPTCNVNFMDDMLSLEDFMDGSMTEDDYNSLIKHTVAKYITGNYGSPYLILPINITEEGEIVFDGKYISEDTKTFQNFQILREIERLRILGVGIENSKIDLEVADFTNPTREEIDKFAALSPAQKIVFLRDVVGYKGLTEYLTTSFYDGREGEFNKKRHKIYLKANEVSIDNLSRMFEDMLYNANPLLRLAAIDLIKYGYIAEVNRFGYTTINKLFGVNGVKSFTDGSLDVGTSVENAMEVIFKYQYSGKFNNSLQSLYDKLSYVRSHYKTFKAQRINFEKLANSAKTEQHDTLQYYKLTPEYTLDENGNRRLVNDYYKNLKSRNGKIIRDVSDETLYFVFNLNNSDIIYLLPLNRLENFEVEKNIEDSINQENNTYPSLGEQIKSIIDAEEENKKIEDVYVKVKENTKFEPLPIGLQGNISIKTNKITVIPKEIYKLAGDRVYSYSFVENGKKITNEYYAVTGNKFKKNPLSEKYNIKDENVIVLIKTDKFKDNYSEPFNEYGDVDLSNHNQKEDDQNIIVANSQFAQNSLVDNLSQIGERFQRNALRKNRNAQQVVKISRLAGINIANPESIAENVEVTTGNILEGIRYDINLLLKDIEKFAMLGVDNNENPIYYAIDEDQVVERAMQDEDFRNRFLNVILRANSLPRQYEDLLYTTTEGLSEETKDYLEDVRERLNALKINDKVKNATRKFWEKYFIANSNNPNVALGFIDFLTAYGDTSFGDYWIQDIRSNKHPLLQVVMKEVFATIEAGRLAGIEQYHEFERKVKEIESKAARNGRVANIDSLLGEDGAIIKANNAEYKKRRDELEKQVILAKNIHGMNSVEYWEAVYNFDNFRTLYEENRTLPATISFTWGDQEITLTDSLDRLKVKLDKLIFENPIAGVKEAFVQYKYYKARIAQINRNTLGALSPEQEQELNECYDGLDGLLNSYNVARDDNGDEIEQLTAVSHFLRLYQTINRSINDIFRTAEEKDSFESELQHNLNILRQYENYDNNGNRIDNVEWLFENKPDFKRAYNWVRKNAIFEYDVDTRTKIENAYQILRDIRRVASGTIFSQYKSDYTDIYGQFNGIKFSQEHPELVKDIKREQLSKYRRFDSAGNPYGGFIRNNTTESVVYTEEFYNGINPTGHSKADDPVYVDLVNAINSILIKHYDYNNKHIKPKSFTIEELEKLDNLLTAINRLCGDSYGDAEFIDANCDFVEDPSFDSDKREVNSMNDNYSELWYKVFSERDRNGNYVGRRVFYGKIKPKAEVEEQFIDKDKTEAVKTLNEFTRETPTKYYYEAKREAESRGTEEYQRWYRENHYFDPYSGRFKPIRIWTYTQYVDALGHTKGKYVARNNQLDYGIKQELLNPNYSEVGVAKINAEKIRGTAYANSAYFNLNEEQRELIDFLRQTMKKYAYTVGDRKFIDKGYLPSVAKDKPMKVTDYVKQGLQMSGWYINPVGQEDMGLLSATTFENDFDTNNEFYKVLLDTTREKLIPLTPKQETETEEQYRHRIEEATAKNAEIRKQMADDHSALLNHNWNQIFRSLITNGEMYNAKLATKPLFFALQEFIKNTEAIRTNAGKVVFRYNAGKPQTVEQTRTLEQIELQMRRLYYDKFKEAGSKVWQNVGALMQNVSGTKYMAVNILGGIANVVTGADNIMMERFAGEYTDLKTWEKAKLLWMQNVPQFLAGMYNDEGVGLVDSIIKYASVVDYDKFVEVNTSEGLRLGFKRFRNLLFSPQNAGEHFMQNTMLLAMMMSHKLVMQEDGTYKIMSKEQYRRDSEIQAIREVIGNNEEEQRKFEEYLEKGRKDEQTRYEYNTFRDNVVWRFVRDNFDLARKREYIRKVDELNKNFNDRYDTIQYTVFDIFEMKDGYLHIKDDVVENKKVLYKELGHFFDKVRQVNNKIHGVYNKLGAAALERKWWGGTVMQYHKHLYPGFKKRWRWNGYYNETLDTIEKGAYVSFFKFMSTPFRDINRRIKEQNGDANFSTFLQAYKNYSKELASFYRHLRTNMLIAPEYEKANMLRCLPDLLWNGAALLISMAAYGMIVRGDWDEDDFLYNLVMYEADRMATEAAAYAWGAYNEFDVLWSSPVAIAQTITDAIKAIGLGANILINSDAETIFKSGKFAHQNKFEVWISRNTPIYRTYYNLVNLDKNNKFYKRQKNILGLVPYKDIVSDFFDY